MLMNVCIVHDSVLSCDICLGIIMIVVYFIWGFFFFLVLLDLIVWFELNWFGLLWIVL